MNAAILLKAGLSTSVLLFFALITFSQATYAWRLEPEVIKEPEGTTVQLQVFIETSDWVLADDAAINTCAGLGYAASKVARYRLKRKDGTARWTSNPNVKDLHLISSGQPTLDPTVLYCGAGHYPTLTIDDSHAINLHNDDEDEGSEQAKLELWSIDEEGDETYITSSSITIDDTAGSTNECDILPLGEGAPATEGSIDETDCDESPRGNGFYADAYTFSAATGESFSVLANWTGMDGYLYLEAPSGPIVAQNDDFTGSGDSRIEYTASQTGTYTVWVTSKELYVSGDYDIEFNPTVVSPDSVGDWVFTSFEATPGQLIVGDELSISIAGQRNGTPTIEVPDSVDVVYLISEDDVLSLEDTVLGGENACCGDGFLGAWQGAIDVPVGNYWVGACFDTTDDNLSNNCTEAAPLVVDAASLCSSQSIQCGSVVESTLASESCHASPQGPEFYAHSYAFSGQAGDTVWLGAEWDFDGYLLLQNSEGRLIAENDNEFNITNSLIEYTLKEDGQYTLWTTSYAPGEGGNYQLAMDCQAPVDGPDLVPEMPSLSASELLPGQEISLSTEIRNAGNQAADSTTAHFKLSSDDKIEWSDPELAGDGVVNLTPASRSTVNAKLAAPMTPGGYWLGVCVGQGGDEVALSNNCSPAAFIEVSSQATCQQQVLSCGQLVSGNLDELDCSLSPRGSGYFAEVLEVDISQGNSLVLDADWIGLDGFLLLQGPNGTVVASNDDNGSKLKSKIEYAAQESGIHRIWTTAARRSHSGSYELQLLCGASTSPDLKPLSVTPETTNAVVDSTITVMADIANAGGSATPLSQVRFLLSVDEKIGSDDTELLATGVAEIAAESSLSVEASVVLPSVAGTYWLGVCVDSVINETLVKNNCSGTTAVSRLSISDSAACTSSALACGDSRSGTLGVDDCDLSPRGPGHVADRFSFNGTAGDIVSIGADWTGLDGILYLQSPSGEIAAENDDFEGEGQSRIEHRLAESGNYRVWSVAREQEQTGTYDLELTCNSPNGPDLHIDAPNLERSQVRPGQKLPLTVSVVNLGKEGAAAARVRYFLSDSASVSYATDRLLGSSDLQSLQPDESSELSRTFTMDVKPGLYWLGACVSGDLLESNIENNCAYSGPLRVDDKGEPVPITPLFNDAWYNPATAGQGFFINVFPDNQQVFLSWFTYDLDRPDESVTAQLGDPGHRWLTGFGSYQRGQANLDVMLNEGGVFDAALPVPQESVYGSMSVTFSDCNNGQIVYDIPTAGEPEVIPITRITSDNLAACEERRVMGDAHAARTPQRTAGYMAGFNINAGINDAWYNPETAGQGLFFNVFQDKEKLFLSWFTYETERPAIDVPFQLGEPGHRWLTALGDYYEDSAELMLYKVDGGVFNSADPAPGETEYGSLLVHVNDCASAELIYDLPSLSREGLIPLQRLAPDSIPLCEASQARVDAGRLNVIPSDKQVLENFCGGSANWSFNWPDSPRASGYELELWRNDMLIPMTFRVSESEFFYEKGSAIQAPHLQGWQWRYRPVFPTAVQSAEFSPVYSFNVGDCEA